ncbi:MAG: hypothetical protein GC181_15525 [Bacteroidetes bacterium]|nr:hypothetical protein [Bacteroidota bacterium]
MIARSFHILKWVLTTITIVGLSIFSDFVQAQKINNIWYFGLYAGIDFNSGSPEVITDSKMYAGEGCATVCDNFGNLLFYTNGEKIWNRRHLVMDGGEGLNGHISSSQSSVIVKKPESKHIYYLFTLENEGRSNGLQYTMIDMSLSGGYGAVISSAKNIKIAAPVCEKIAVVLHSNQKDYWIITHQVGSNRFSSFQLTSGGINPNPVVSSVGKTLTGFFEYKLGYLKASQDGSKLACASVENDYFLVADINTSSGFISNGKDLTTFGAKQQGTYGLEFSESGQYLYVGEYWGNTRIFQFDVSKATANEIQQSMYKVADCKADVGAIQMGPDGVIYIDVSLSEYLMTIEHPDLPGAKCSYKENAIYLKGKQCSLGLPTFVNSFVSGVTYDSVCPGEYVQFHAPAEDFDSVHWDFGDPLSGSDNTSTQFNPRHKFTDGEYFWVEVTLYHAGSYRTITIKIMVPDFPKPDLGKDKTICKGDKIILKASPVTGSFQWNDGSTGSTLTVTEAGVYSVKADVNNCPNRDTVVINVQDPIPVDLGRDTSFCMGDSLYLDALPNPGSFVWNTGSSESGIFIKQSGEYWVKAINGKCVSGDTINVTVYDLPVIDLGPDTSICDTDQFLLKANSSYEEIVWSDGSRAAELMITQSQVLWAKAINGTCEYADTVKVTFGESANLRFQDSTKLCDDDVQLLDATTPNSQYLWQDGSNQPTFLINSPGIYWVTITNTCGEFSDTTVAYESSCDCFFFVPNAFTPNHDGHNESFGTVATGCDFIVFHLTIYNLWGERIFESFNESEKWNGKFDQHFPQSNVYLYQFEGITRRNHNVRDNGTITVLR